MKILASFFRKKYQKDKNAPVRSSSFVLSTCGPGNRFYMEIYFSLRACSGSREVTAVAVSDFNKAVSAFYSSSFSVNFIRAHAS